MRREGKISVYFRKLINKIISLLPPSPKEVSYANIAITYLCNSRCRHCSIWKIYKHHPSKVQEELTFEEIKAVFEKSHYLSKLKSITLTGGEPFLRKDFVELCGFFASKYPRAGICIPTNALDPNLIVKKLEELMFDYSPNPRNIYISISLDGIGKTHDEIRGVAGSYQNVLRLIMLIKECLPAINQGISFTITPDNYNDLLKAYELSKKLNVGFYCQFAQISESYYRNVEAKFEWSREKLCKVKNILSTIAEEFYLRQTVKQRINDVSMYYFSHMVEFQENPHRMFTCYSGIHSFFMDPYGNIYPCIMLNKRLGNILYSSFDEIWFSRRAYDVRRFIKNKKCYCWTPCETMPSLSRNPKVLLWNLREIVRRGKI